MKVCNILHIIHIDTPEQRKCANIIVIEESLQTYMPQDQMGEKY